jgi:tetratricopeptide (TPR) repeat protein
MQDEKNTVDPPGRTDRRGRHICMVPVLKRDAGRAASVSRAHEPVPKASELKPTPGFSFPPLHAANEAALGHLLSGLNRLSAGDRVGAESDFLQATVLDAGDSDAYTALANSQEMQANWVPAEENYRNALALNPSQRGALTGLGNVSYHNSSAIE